MKISKKLLKVGLIIMAVLGIASFSACMNNLNIDTAHEIESLLESKYNEKFVAYSVGNRLAAEKVDTVTAYCYPVSNEQIKFTALMNISRELVSDKYIESQYEYLVKDYFTSVFQKDFIDAYVLPSVTNINRDFSFDINNTNVPELIKNNNELYLSMKIVVSDNVDLQLLYNVFIKEILGFYKSNNTLKIGGMVWVIKDSSFKTCVEQINEYHFITDVFFDDFDVIGSSSVGIGNGEISKSFDKFYDEIGIE